MMKSDNFRHFPYKHPTFGTKYKQKTKSAWEGSVYYWWWQYLRRNQDYLETCANDGRGKLEATYKEFGDVRSDDFKAWWSGGGRGGRLFANPRAEDSIRVLGPNETALGCDEVLTVSIPLNLPRKMIEQRLKKLLDAHHTGKRGYQLAKKSTARFRVHGQPNVPALAQGLLVYDAVTKAVGVSPKTPHWKIATDLKIVPLEQRVLAKDTDAEKMDKKRILTITVSRYMRRVRESIRRAGQGVFP